MKRTLKKAMSILLAAVMVFGTFCSSYSNAQENSDIKTQSSSGFRGGSGLNPLAQSFSEEDKRNYSIVWVEVDGKTATVELNNESACTLVVAVYEEGSTHMIACAVEDIEPSAGTVKATVDIDVLPQYYFAKVYLLNSDYTSLSDEEYLLCEPYTYNGKTKAYEQFLAKEPEDFSGEEIIIFDDEKERTDFAVFTDDVVLSDDSGEMAFTYDEATATYTFTKAPDDLADLKPGDIYYYQYGEASNEFLLFKVKSVTASGSETVVQADTDFGIGEAFSFVRVDADADFSGIDDSDMSFGEGYTQADENGEISTMSIADEEKFVYSTALRINCFKDSAVSLSAEIGFAASAGSRLYYDIELFGEDFYEFRSSYTFAFNIFSFTVTGKIELPSDDYEIISPAIPVGPFGLTFSVAPVMEFSGSASGSLKYVNNVVVTADNTNGVNRHIDATNTFEPLFEKEFTVRIGLQGNISLGWKEWANLKLTLEAAVQFSGEPDSVGIKDEKHHSCRVCIVGEADLAASGSLSFNIEIIPDKMEFSYPFISLEKYFHLYDFYISTTEQGVKFDKGNCPNLRYKATITVLNENGEVISDVTVSCLTGICDSDGDGEFAETSSKTDSSGKAVFYLKEGSHSVKAEHPEYMTENAAVNMIAASKKRRYYNGGKHFM